MADYKKIAPFSKWQFPAGANAFKLSSKEICRIAESSSPVSTFVSLFPGAQIPAAGIAIAGWALKEADKFHGSQGLVIVAGISTALIQIPVGVTIKAPSYWNKI